MGIRKAMISIALRNGSILDGSIVATMDNILRIGEINSSRPKE